MAKMWNKAESFINTLRADNVLWTPIQELQHITREKRIDKKTQKELNDPVWIIKFSKDGRYLASGGHDGTVKVWCLLDDPIAETIRTFNSGPSPLIKLGSHHRSATADDVKNISSPNLRPKSPRTPKMLSFKKSTEKIPVKDSSLLFQPTPLRVFIGHDMPITDISWSYSESFIVSSSVDSTVRLWNILSNECLCVFKHPDIVSSVCFHPTDHSLFISGCLDGKIRLWSILEKKLISWSEASQNSVTAVAFTIDGMTAIAGSMSGDCMFFDMPELRYDTQISITPLKSLRNNRIKNNYKITGIEYIPSVKDEDRRILVSSADSKIRIYNLRDKSLYKSFKGHTCQSSLIRSRIDETGSVLVSASEDNYLHVWYPKREMEESSSWLASRTSDIAKMNLPDKIVIEDNVVCTEFTSAKLMEWKSSFQSKVSSKNLPFLQISTTKPDDISSMFYIIAGDVSGKLTIYQCQSSAITDFRSFLLENKNESMQTGSAKSSPFPNSLVRQLSSSSNHSTQSEGKQKFSIFKIAEDKKESKDNLNIARTKSTEIIKDQSDFSSVKMGKNHKDHQEDIVIKPSLFGNWTGKTPQSLLYEHCQRNGWEKPVFKLISKGRHDAFQYSIVLEKRDKKSKNSDNSQYITLADVTSFKSDQEARHFAATFALHRFASHLSIHTLLPPSHREYWEKLEITKYKLNSQEKAKIYSPDPFAKPTTPHNPSKNLSKSDTIKKSTLPEVHLTSELRQEIENLIRHIGYKRLASTPFKPSKKDIESLIKLGFREAHVLESMSYCSTYTESLNWLCIHVPEDDLPPNFLSSTSKEIFLHKYTQESLSAEYSLKRLISTGYNRTICLDTLDVCKGDEISAIALMTQTTFKACSKEENYLDSTEDFDYKFSWNEEISTLIAIYPESTTEVIETNGRVWSICIPDTSTYVEIFIPNLSKYPFEIPGLVIRDKNLPAYIRLGIIRELVKNIHSYLGMPMAFSIVCWLQDNLENLINNPPSLMSFNTIFNELDSQIKSSKKEANNTSIKGTPKNTKFNFKDLNVMLKITFEAKKSSSAYQKMFKIREKLPSFKYREKILNIVRKNQYIIICGETGCGKSTQLGQFILEDMILSLNGGSCNIVCTQPRRISATALASRVSEEQAEKLGELVGFKIKGESASSKNTRLTFMTTGVLLRMLQFDNNLSDISHIIIDEVHERTVDGDLLLVLLKSLAVRRPDLKILLMSATIDSDIFSSYFYNAPVIEIPGFTYPVEDKYLEDFIRLIEFSKNDYIWSRTNKQSMKTSLEEITESTDDYLDVYLRDVNKGVENINYTLISKLVRFICNMEEEKKGAILIFLPGAFEISKCIQAINELSLKDVVLLSLHANLSNKNQSEVFRRVPAHQRKIVVATNIAETSITIDDVVYVIDSGKVKEMQYENSILSLKEIWASKASCKQRRGRAGRVQQGMCFKLFTRHFHDKKMIDIQFPEILRIPLEQLCLSIKAMGHENIKEFLSMAISSPALDNVNLAIKNLQQLNALDNDEKLTSLGRHIATFPTDLKLAKFLIFGTILGCIEPALTIAACISSKSIFINSQDAREEAKKARDQFSLGESDWLTSLQAFDQWSNLSSKKEKQDFCANNYISMFSMIEISKSRNQYLDSLIELGYLPSNYNALQKPFNNFSSNIRVVKGALVAGLYPNIVRIKYPPQKYAETSHGVFAVDSEPSSFKFYDFVERVFIHPASINSASGKFKDPFLIYNQKVQTSKVYIRDTTTVSAWPILLFGGNIDVDHKFNTLIIDQHLKVEAFPRVGALIHGLRTLLDAELDKKIEDTSLNIIDSAVGKLLTKILTSEGL